MARRAARASFARLTGTVTIAGGGLAGLSLAAGLRLRGIPVTVREAGRYPRHRVCGEFISGVERETLEQLGIAGALADALPRSSVAWFREGRRIHEGALPEPALGISRHRLDLRLKERVVALGGTVEEAARVARGAKEGVVWAAGRIPRRGPWIGLKTHFHGLPMAADLEMHLGANGYAGLAGVEDGRVNVCGLFRIDRDVPGRGADLLASYLRAGGNRMLAGRLDAAVMDPASFCAVAGFQLGRQHAEPGLCPVGDAESMIPPFTGNGMSMAFQSAALALDPLERWSRGRLSWDGCVAEIRTLQRRRFRRRLAAAQALHPLLLRAGGRDAIEAIAAAGLLPFRPLLSLVR
jgi:2-polyprenyl-6-methoxyphenol hydroxylase-like FAD-dependent oxidoreductase